MTSDDLAIIEKLDKATYEIFGRHVPLILLIRFYRAVMYPEIPKVEPIRQKVRQLNPRRGVTRIGVAGTSHRRIRR